MKSLNLILLFIITLGLFTCNNSTESAYSIFDDGIIVIVDSGKVKLKVCNENIINVVFTVNNDFPEYNSLSLVEQKQKSIKWEVHEFDNKITLSTAKVKTEVHKKTGQVKFYDNDGNVLLSEADNKSRIMKPVVVLNDSTYNIAQSFNWKNDEALYGLGQHRDGVMNYRGHHALLVQENKIIAMPCLVSNKGYGIFWDNASLTKFMDGEASPIPTNLLFNEQGNQGGLSAFYYKKDNPDYTYKTFEGLEPSFTDSLSIAGATASGPEVKIE